MASTTEHRFWVWKVNYRKPWAFFDSKYSITHYYETWQQAMERIDKRIEFEKRYPEPLDTAPKA